MTSGSTGYPKFVMVNSQNLLERTLGEVRLFDLKENDVILNFLSFSHDLGLNQLLTCVTTGATLFIYKINFFENLFYFLNKYKITGFTAVPSFWRMYLNQRNVPVPIIEKFKYITVSGGSLSLNELEKVRSFFPNSNLIKTYGKTETFRSLARIYKPGEILDENTGKAISEVHLHFKEDVTNIDYAELIHAGAGLMINYYSHIENQKEIKFHETGDLFLMKKNNYCYITRKDQMQKINGHRFYPQLIENELRLLDSDITEIAVVVKNTNFGFEKIIAFIQSNSDINETAIRMNLRCKLPENLIPHSFIKMQPMPKTVSGKIDLQALMNMKI